MTSKEKKKEIDLHNFISGVVSALDVVAQFDEPAIFKEIVECNGVLITLKEIGKNGLSATKEMAKSIYGDK
jgi:hypothetical protein